MTELLSLNNISKQYPRVSRSRDRLRGLIQTLAGVSQGQGEVVLQDINLTVRRGESLAIVGENGAGKSTLLKLIAGVLHPTTGTIETNGSIAALLELGAGFHPEYTGLQNLRSAASLMGMSELEFEQSLPDIIQFSGLDDALELPVKKYSSGMMARLGFSLITVVKPDLLISDEVLSVGDESFQKKCIAWLQDYLKQGGTLLLVSHSAYHVQKLCQHACWLDNGRIVKSGDVFSVCQSYSQETRMRHGSKLDEIFTREMEIRQLALHDESGQQLNMLESQHVASSRLLLEYNNPPISCFLRYRVLSADGTVVSMTQQTVSHSLRNHDSNEPSANSLCVTVTKQWCFEGLLPGHYTLEVIAMDEDGQVLSNVSQCELVIEGQSMEFGSLRIPHQWTAA